MLEIDNLCLRFGDRKVLDGVSLELGSEQSMAVVGPSGTGKSTLLRCILGAQRPDSGSILIDGQQVIGLQEKQLRALRSKHIGMVFQHGELISELDAKQNVMLPLLINGVPKRQAETRARDLLAALGVHLEELPVDKMSGGERQRTALARALIATPSVVLADEPTGALDSKTRDETADVIVNWCKEYGCALLMVTHDYAVAARTDRVATLDQGVLRIAGGEQSDPEPSHFTR